MKKKHFINNVKRQCRLGPRWLAIEHTSPQKSSKKKKEKGIKILLPMTPLPLPRPHKPTLTEPKKKQCWDFKIQSTLLELTLLQSTILPLPFFSSTINDIFILRPFMSVQQWSRSTTQKPRKQFGPSNGQTFINGTCINNLI